MKNLHTNLENEWKQAALVTIDNNMTNLIVKVKGHIFSSHIVGTILEIWIILIKHL